MKSIREHRRAQWRLRRDFRRMVRGIADEVRYRVDTVRLEALRSRAYRGDRENADMYARYAARYWRVWG